MVGFYSSVITMMHGPINNKQKKDVLIIETNFFFCEVIAEAHVIVLLYEQTVLYV